MKPLYLHRLARRELTESIAYYDGVRAGLGSEFLDQVLASLQRIQRSPKAGSPYTETRFRHVQVRRFPYVIYYRELDSEIRISALAHAARRPGYWRRRKFD